MIEKNIKSFKKDILEYKNKSTVGFLLSYDEGVEKIRNLINEQMIKDNNNQTNAESYSEKEKIVKDKDYLKAEIEKKIEEVDIIVKINNIRITNYEDKMGSFVRDVANELVGLDILSDAYENPKVTDIYVLAWNNIWIEDNGENKEYHRHFRSSQHLKDFINSLVNEAGLKINEGECKKVDFELFGDRYCATHPIISPKDYSLTIRKHAKDFVTFDDLMEGDLFTEEMAELVRLTVKGERNVIVAGITGSGKTTTMRAVLDRIIPELNKRVLTQEDTRELFLKNKHTLELVSSLTGDLETEITLQQLVYTALRLKPQYIVVGEVREKEAQAAIEAMETGHSTWITMHAGEPINCINRLVTKYLTAMPTLGIEVVERIVGSAIDYIFIQDNVPGIGRRITDISEVDYDFDKRTVAITPIYKFDIRSKKFIKLNHISQKKIDLMLRRGVKYQEIEDWEKKEKINDIGQNK